MITRKGEKVTASTPATVRRLSSHTMVNNAVETRGDIQA